jgi:hypothetical protein
MRKAIQPTTEIIQLCDAYSLSSQLTLLVAVKWLEAKLNVLAIA